MKKIIAILTLVSILLLVAGCEGNTSTTSKGGYIGGNQGLIIQYALDSPPAKVLDADQETFSIALQLTNKGEYDIKAGEVIATLTGINYITYGITDSTLKNVAQIEKVKKTAEGIVLDGGVSTDISYTAGYKEDLPVDQSETIVTNVCYRYQTEATTAMCLRKEVTGKGETSDSCKVGDALIAGNSGAPIQITQMTESIAGKNQVSLTMKIENVGTGVAYTPEGLLEGKCSETGTKLKDYKNKVQVQVSFPTLPSAAVSCGKFKGTSSGTLDLVGGKTTTLSCTIDTTNLQETTFTSSPKVLVDYMYKESINQAIQIQNVL